MTTVAAQLDRSDDLLLRGSDGVRVGPEAPARPLTRREHRARERAAATHHAQQQAVLFPPPGYPATAQLAVTAAAAPVPVAADDLTGARHETRPEEKDPAPGVGRGGRRRRFAPSRSHRLPTGPLPVLPADAAAAARGAHCRDLPGDVLPAVTAQPLPPLDTAAIPTTGHHRQPRPESRPSLDAAAGAEHEAPPHDGTPPGPGDATALDIIPPDDPTALDMPPDGNLPDSVPTPEPPPAAVTDDGPAPVPVAEQVGYHPRRHADPYAAGTYQPSTDLTGTDLAAQEAVPNQPTGSTAQDTGGAITEQISQAAQRPAESGEQVPPSRAPVPDPLTPQADAAPPVDPPTGTAAAPTATGPDEDVDPLTTRVLYRPLVEPSPAGEPPARNRLRGSSGARTGSAGAEDQVLYRPSSIQDPGRLLPPGRPGAPARSAPAVGDATAATPGAGRPQRPGRHSPGRLLLAGFAVIGIVAGVFGGLRLGAQITGARAAERPAADGTGSATPSSGPTPDESPSDRGAQAQLPAGGGATGGVASPTAETDLYLYWVTSSATRSLLAREYRSVPDYGDPLLSAVQAVLHQRPADPDYESPWRAASAVKVTNGADRITVTLSSDAFSAPDVGSDRAGAALQQLVWTVTAAAQRDVPVTVVVTGHPGFRAWGSVALDRALRRDGRFRASVWIDTPLEATTQRGKVRISGQGSGFEGSYHWKVTRDGRQVAAGVASGSPAGPGTNWSQFAVDLQLPPGSYLTTVTADAPDDREMPAGWTWPATRSFTVG